MIFSSPVKFLRRFLRHREGIAMMEFAIVFPFLFLLLFGGIELTRYIIIHQKVEKSAEVIGSIVSQEPAAVANPASGITQQELEDNVYPHFNSVMGYFGCCTATPTAAVIVTSVMKKTVGEPGCVNQGDTTCMRVQWQSGYKVPGSSSTPQWKSALTDLAPDAADEMKSFCKDTVVNGVLVDRFCQPPPGISGGVGTAHLTAEEQGNIRNMLPGENMIITEVFYQYKPIIQPLLQNMGTMTGLPFWLSAQSIQKRVFLRPRLGNLTDLPPDFPAVP